MPRSPGEHEDLGGGARAAGALVLSAVHAAALGTMLCFAFLDPLALAEGQPPAWWTTRLRVYAMGFFLFWLIGMVAALICWNLARPAPRDPK
jgi:hypothetical protein